LINRRARARRFRFARASPRKYLIEIGDARFMLRRISATDAIFHLFE
jgi:hypothetical protein